VIEVLCLCTHNRTRSVLMAALLGAHPVLRSTVSVSTGGFRAAGLRPTEPAVRILRGRGIDVEGHRSRTVDDAAVRAADLILTAEHRHVVDVAGRWPDAFRRTFTLPELVVRARRCGPRAGRPLDEWLDEVGVGRPTALAYLDDPTVGEIPDPTAQPERVWDEVLRRLDDLVARAAEVLR